MPPAQVPGSRRRKEQSYRSVISDIFDGSVLSLVQCLTCDRVGAARGGERCTGLPTQLGAGALALCPVPPDPCISLETGPGPRAPRVPGLGSWLSAAHLSSGSWGLGPDPGSSGQGRTLADGKPG